MGNAQEVVEGATHGIVIEVVGDDAATDQQFALCQFRLGHRTGACELRGRPATQADLPP